MKHEITLTSSGSIVEDGEVLKSVLDAISNQAKDNSKNELAGQQTFGFQRSFGKIEFEGEWGLVREDNDDIIEVSKLFPDYDFHLVKFWENTTASSVEDLSSNYVKLIFGSGTIKSVLRPAPIVWVEA